MAKTCITCRYWEHTDREYGECEIITNGLAKADAEVILDIPDLYQEREISFTFETHKDFSCKIWDGINE